MRQDDLLYGAVVVDTDQSQHFCKVVGYEPIPGYLAKYPHEA